MKRSSIITKIVLALLIVAMIFAFAACGKKKKTTPTTPDTPATVSAIEQLSEIITKAAPIIDTVKGIDKNSTVSLDLGLSVDYKSGTNSDSYALSLKGNVAKTNPSLAINFKTKQQEWLNVTYLKSNGKAMAYLNQPLTAVNTTGWDPDASTVKTDKVSFDVTALEPSVNSAMEVVMDVLEGLAKSQALKDLDLASLGTSLKETLNGINLDSMITIETTDSGYTIKSTPELFKTVRDLLGSTVIAAGITVNDVMNMLFKDETPTIVIDAGIANNAVNKIALGYTFSDGDYGKIVIDLAKLSTSSTVDISAPSGYEQKALKASANAYVGHDKDLDVTFDAYANANFSDAYLAYAQATIKTAAENYTLKGVATNSDDKNIIKFNMAGIYDALGLAKPAVTDYTAVLHDNKTTTRDEFSIVKMINDGVADWNTDYFANKGKAKPADPNPTGTTTNPTKSIIVSIYEFLGGNLADLGTNATDKNYKAGDEVKYNDPTEKQVMTALDAKIGKYVNFTIDKTSNSDNYLKTVKNILALFAANDQWIIGYDLVKTDLSGITTWKDFGTFSKWVELENGKVKDSAIQTAGKNNNTQYQYGIFNWDTDNYNGGVIITKEGEHNDLLDAVNVFVKWAPNGEEQAVAFTSENISEYMNYYIAALGYYMGDGVIFSASDKEAIDAADAIIADSTKTKEEKDAAQAVLDGFYTTANANAVLTKVLGYTPATGTNSLKTMIDEGMYLNLGSQKNKGIYGFVELRVSEAANSAVFARASIGIEFVANTVVTDATAATFANDAIDLTAYTGSGDDAVYTNVGDAEERTGILGELLKIWDGYCAYTKPIA